MAPETKKNILWVGLALLLSLAFRTGVAQAYVVQGPSMEPTLYDGERMFVDRRAFGLSVPGRTASVMQWAVPDPGDLVVIEGVDGVDLVKRVVGVPGDTISFAQGRLIRNGVPLADPSTNRPCDPERFLEPSDSCQQWQERLGDSIYWSSANQAAHLRDQTAVTVQEGYVFVLGDHRDRSNDSRSFGALSMRRLRGRVHWVW